MKERIFAAGKCESPDVPAFLRKDRSGYAPLNAHLATRSRMHNHRGREENK